MAFGEVKSFRDLLINHDIRLGHSEELGSIPLNNYAEQCPSAVDKYLRSMKFRRDLENLEDEIWTAQKSGWLHIMELWFRTDPKGDLSLSLEFSEDIDKL